MNFYKRHLGDIAKSCSDLSQGEMGAYDLLMDWLYANEKPLPNIHKKLYQIGRASTKAERANVDSVIAQLFVLTDSGYIQKRVMEEIEHAAEVSESARKSANARWGNPQIGEDAKRIRNASETHSVRNASQTPDSIALGKSFENSNLEASTTIEDAQAAKKRGSRLPPDWKPAETELAWARAQNPGLDVQREADKFRDFWIAKPGREGVKLDWAATWRNWIRNARAGPPAKPSIAQQFSEKSYTGTPDDELPACLQAPH